MTSLQYEDIFSYFLGYVTDFHIMNLTEDNAYSLMSEYMHKAASKPYVRRLFSTAIFDDDVEEFTYELKYQTDDDSDYDFTLDLLSKAMVIEWLQPQVKSKVNTMQFFGGKEQNFYSQANHVSELRGLLEDITLEVRKMIRDRGYIHNTYLDGTMQRNINMVNSQTLK